MRRNVIAIDLSREERHTLGLLLPLSYQIVAYSSDALSTKEMEAFMKESHCIVINPKKLAKDQLATLLYQHDKAEWFGCAPILLLSDAPTRAQIQCELEGRECHRVDLHKRMDRTLRSAVKILRQSFMPSWAHMKQMEANMFNDGWYLIDLETTGIRPTQDDIVAVRIAYMAAYEIVGYETILVNPGKPLTAEQEEMLGITNEMLSRAATLERVVKDLADPSHPAPIITWDEDYTIAFLEAAFHRCGRVFDRPYVALESLSALAFGSHLLRSPREICSLDRMKTIKRSPVRDEELAALYDATLTIFETLQRRDVRAPGYFDKLFGFEYEECD